jgi:hypothetical protein
MDTTKPVKISLSGKMTFVEQISLSQAAQIVAFLDSTDPAASGFGLNQSGNSLSSTRRAQGGTSAPRESLDRSGAKTNPEKIVALGLHVLMEGGKETFSIEDVKPLFRRAGEAAPANMSRDVDVAVRLGWIAESETKGEYFVTDKALNVLESGFAGLKSGKRTAASSGSSKTRSTVTKKTRKTSQSVPPAFSNVDTISPTLDGLIDYHKLKTKTDKFLWAVNAAKTLGVDSVTNQEIVWLTDVLGEGISANDIGGNFRQNHKVGYVNRSTRDNKIRITPNGEEYLKSKSGP